MLHFARYFLPVVVSVAFSVFVAPLAQAEESAAVERARTLFNIGVQRYDQGNYQGALEAFEEAYRLRPHPAVRLNMASCYDHLGRDANAVFHYERYLEEAGGDKERQKDVEEALEKLYKKMGKLTVTVSPDGSTVLVDDSEPRVSPIKEPIHLEAGEHKITVTQNGYEPAKRRVKIGRGELTEIIIALKKKSDAAVASVPAAVTEQPPPEQISKPEGEGEAVQSGEPIESSATQSERVALAEIDRPSNGSTDDRDSIFGGSRILISGAVTAAFGMAALVCTVAALGAEMQYNSSIDAASNSPSVAESDAHRTNALLLGKQADNLWIATGFLFAGTLFSGAVMTYFLISEGERGNKRVGLTPAVSRNCASLTVVGGF
ncbi:MAG: PEGA domain-containing protein [Deltaproteobacteria bacterium]|nr:PEGA domain-containing protein [Deltaproteobacteria bacterium]